MILFQKVASLDIKAKIWKKNNLNDSLLIFVSNFEAAKSAQIVWFFIFVIHNTRI